MTELHGSATSRGANDVSNTLLRIVVFAKWQARVVELSLAVVLFEKSFGAVRRGRECHRHAAYLRMRRDAAVEKVSSTRTEQAATIYS